MTSFDQCWNTTRQAAESDANIKKNMDQYMKMMRILEPQFKCSGACTNALFWFTLPISTAPDGGCLSAVTTQLAGQYVFPGFACIVSSVIMLMIFSFQYLLWCEDAD